MKRIIAAIALALPFVLSSCVKDQVYGGVSITDIKNTLAYTEFDAVTVTAKAEALVPVTSMKLVYDAGKGAQTVDMTPTNGGDNVYGAVIPAQPVDTKVKYHIEAATATASAKSGDIEYKVGEVPIDYSGLIINELNGTDKFIELTNTGADIPTLYGVYIEKDGKSVWVADNRGLKKGEFLLLYSEDVTGAGGAHEGYPEALVFHSGLSAKKAVRVQLFTPAAASLSDFNLVNCVKTAAASYSRNKDGKWYHATATPGAANVEGTDPVEGLE